MCGRKRLGDELNPECSQVVSVAGERCLALGLEHASSNRVSLQATSAGAKDQEAENFLEKKVKANASFSFDEAVQTAISALQNVLSEDLKASEIEVGVASQAGGRKFRVLRSEEVEEHLTAISERD